MARISPRTGFHLSRENELIEGEPYLIDPYLMQIVGRLRAGTEPLRDLPDTEASFSSLFFYR